MTVRLNGRFSGLNSKQRNIHTQKYIHTYTNMEIEKQKQSIVYPFLLILECSENISLTKQNVTLILKNFWFLLTGLSIFIF